MSGSTENRASGASEKRGGRDVLLTLVAANRMLPLVQHIVTELMECQQRLERLQPEKDRLDRHRRDLAWPERERRYQLEEEITNGEKSLRATLAELEALGLTMLNSERGEVGFPTKVNKRQAWFSWLPGEQTISFWQYADEDERRPVPSGWTEAEARRKTKD